MSALWPTGDLLEVAEQLHACRSTNPEMWELACDVLGLPAADVESLVNAVLGGAA